MDPNRRVLAVMVAMSGLLRRVVGAEIRGLRGEMTAEIGWLRGGMNARFDAVDVRFDGVDRRLHGLDQDVQALTRRSLASTTGADRRRSW